MIVINDDIQGQLFAIAYKMTGQVAQSKDICQEAIRKCLQVEQSLILNSKAYLIKATINTAIDHLNRIKKERESYFGIWLPEPILEHRAIDAALDLDYGLTVVLGKLSPKERAVFILKESFDYPYQEIADLLELSSANCRKIFQRLQDKIKAPAQRAIENQEKERIVKAFLNASQTGDMENLLQILKEDIVLYSDGGGKVSAAKNVLRGLDVCLKFLFGIYTKNQSKMRFEAATINGQTGFLVYENESIATICSFELTNGQISAFYFMRNPDKINAAQLSILGH